MTTCKVSPECIDIIRSLRKSRTWLDFYGDNDTGLVCSFRIYKYDKWVEQYLMSDGSISDFMPNVFEEFSVKSKIPKFTDADWQNIQNLADQAYRVFPHSDEDALDMFRSTFLIAYAKSGHVRILQ